MKSLLDQDCLGFCFGIVCTMAFHNSLKQKIPAFLEEIMKTNDMDKIPKK